MVLRMSLFLPVVHAQLSMPTSHWQDMVYVTISTSIHGRSQAPFKVAVSYRKLDPLAPEATGAMPRGAYADRKEPVSRLRSCRSDRSHPQHRQPSRMSSREVDDIWLLATVRLRTRSTNRNILTEWTTCNALRVKIIEADGICISALKTWGRSYRKDGTQCYRFCASIRIAGLSEWGLVGKATASIGEFC